jgi:hypothetical protein
MEMIRHDHDTSSSTFPSNRRHRHPVPRLRPRPVHKFQQRPAVLSLWKETTIGLALEPTPPRTAKTGLFYEVDGLLWFLAPTAKIGPLQSTFWGPTRLSFGRSTPYATIDMAESQRKDDERVHHVIRAGPPFQHRESHMHDQSDGPHRYGSPTAANGKTPPSTKPSDKAIVDASCKPHAHNRRPVLVQLLPPAPLLKVRLLHLESPPEFVLPTKCRVFCRSARQITLSPRRCQRTIRKCLEPFYGSRPQTTAWAVVKEQQRRRICWHRLYCRKTIIDGGTGNDAGQHMKDDKARKTGILR